MLVTNQTLQELSITCNQLGEVCPLSLCMIMTLHDTYMYTHIQQLKFPNIMQAGGKLLQEGVEENKTLTTLDLRLTEISAENEYTINQIIRTNANRSKS